MFLNIHVCVFKVLSHISNFKISLNFKKMGKKKSHHMYCMRGPWFLPLSQLISEMMFWSKEPVACYNGIRKETIESRNPVCNQNNSVTMLK